MNVIEYLNPEVGYICKVYNKNVGKIPNKNVVFPTFLFCIQRYIGTLLLGVNRYGKQSKRRANDYG